MEGKLSRNSASDRGPLDVVPYGFLKDIHRMERLKHVIVGGRRVVPPYRVCALISNEPFDTDGKTVHERMRLYPRTLPASHLVQFNEKTESGKATSLNTLWRDYPPFRLVRSYELRWDRVDTADVVPAEGETRQYPPFQVLAVDVSFAG